MSLFKVGDRVRLNPMCDFYLNSLESSKYEVGSVSEIISGIYPYLIKWPQIAEVIPHCEKELIPADVPTPSEKEMEELL